MVPNLNTRIADAAVTPPAAPGEPAAPTGRPVGPARSREWSSGHPVNIRLSLPLLFGRFYITIVAGRERRSRERLAAEARKHPLATAGNLLFLTAFGTIAGLAGLALIQIVIRGLFAAT